MSTYLIKTLRNTGINFTMTEAEYIFCMVQISELEPKIDFKIQGTILTNGINEARFDLYTTAKNKMSTLKPNFSIVFELLDKVGNQFGI